MMMIDAFLPEGITQLTVDSIFMMPQLGVLAKVHENAALSVFDKDCLIYLGTCIAPIGTLKYGAPAVEVELLDGKNEKRTFKSGELNVIPCAVGESVKARIKPMRGLDFGEGDGKEIEATLHGGVVGLIFDTRGRPFTLPTDRTQRIQLLQAWNKALDLYPNL